MKINGYVTDCFKSRYTTLGKPYFHVTQCFIGISLSFGIYLTLTGQTFNPLSSSVVLI